VLVWSPVTLVLDAGAMLQLLILVRADNPRWWSVFITLVRGQSDKGATRKSLQDHTDPPTADSVEMLHHRVIAPQPTQSSHVSSFTGGHEEQPTSPPPPKSFTSSTHSSQNLTTPTQASAAHILFVTFIIISSFLLVLSIIILQLVGLIAAFRGHKTPNMTASWCSPMFALFGVAELDGNTCEFHAITGNPHKGIGCVDLPGARQSQWLIATIIIVLLSIAIEVADLIILLFVNVKTEWWIVKLQRPWFTMIFGLVVLVLILAMGTIDAYSMPSGITEKIWLVVDAKVGNSGPFVCHGTLTPGGLRGQFLGWLDGLLQTWGTTYFGLS
jgi:hypothetical protein